MLFKTRPTPFFALRSLLFIMTLFSIVCCNPKPKDEVTEEPTQAPIDCEVWKSNHKFINATYTTFRNEDGRIYVNKLSLLQLINSLQVESDPKLQERKVKLLEKLNAAPALANNEILFETDAITLRDQLGLMIGEYMAKCAVAQ